MNQLNNNLYVKRLSDKAILPTYSNDFSAGLDLYSPIDICVLPHTRSLIKLDISISLPPQTYGHIVTRSGLAFKHGIHIETCVVDEDFTGNLSLLFYNFGDKLFMIKKGDRIAQMVINPYLHVDVKDVDSIEN
jgi:dUTP pyrophosphatase